VRESILLWGFVVHVISFFRVVTLTRFIYFLFFSTTIHYTNTGVTALVAAIILGPRLGRFHDADGNPLDEPNEFPPHSVTLQFLGTFCLWFGWYGFNPGSVLAISTAKLGDVASLVAVNTTLAACSGAITAMFVSTWWDVRQVGLAQWDLGYTMNGCLTGLVAITSPCATVDTWAAVVIGIGAGIFYLLASKLLVRLRIDDAVDAIPVHMVGGAWGVIAAGLFTSPQRLEDAFGKSEHVGWFYSWHRGSGDFTLLGVQLLGVAFIFGWVAVTMGAYFYILKVLGLFRIDALEEEAGMDISRHKGPAYDMDGSAKKEVVEQLNTSRRSLNVGVPVEKAIAPDDDADKEEVGGEA
jgi:ammonium transporter, Amt family